MNKISQFWLKNYVSEHTLICGSNKWNHTINFMYLHFKSLHLSFIYKKVFDKFPNLFVQFNTNKINPYLAIKSFIEFPIIKSRRK